MLVEQKGLMSLYQTSRIKLMILMQSHTLLETWLQWNNAYASVRIYRITLTANVFILIQIITIISIKTVLICVMLLKNLNCYSMLSYFIVKSTENYEMLIFTSFIIIKVRVLFTLICKRKETFIYFFLFAFPSYRCILRLNFNKKKGISDDYSYLLRRANVKNNDFLKMTRCTLFNFLPPKFNWLIKILHSPS